MKNKQKKKKPFGWIFLGIIVIAYALLAILKTELFISSISIFYNLLKQVIPVFIVVYLLMTLTNYFITSNFVKKHLNERGIKKWFFAIIGGILSSGPIYIWYPWLRELRKKGVSNGLIACFLYNRAIKIALLPLAIFYFGVKFVVILTIVMVFFSVIEGVLMDKLLALSSKDRSY